MLLRDKRQPIKKPFLAILISPQGMASKKRPDVFGKTSGRLYIFLGRFF